MNLIPNEVKVGGLKYSVQQDYEFSESNDCTAIINYKTLSIKLSSGNNQQVNEQSYLHELIHAIDNVFSDGKLKEEQVEALAQGLYSVLVDNYEVSVNQK